MRIYRAFFIICMLLLLSGCTKEASVPISEPQVTAQVTAVAEPAVTDTPAPIGTPVGMTLNIYTPTPSPSPVPTPSPTPIPYLGRWSYAFGESEIVLQLEADGTGSVTWSGTAQPFTWIYSEGKLLLSGTRAAFEAVFSSGTLTLTTADGDVVFTGKELS